MKIARALLAAARADVLNPFLSLPLRCLRFCFLPFALATSGFSQSDPPAFTTQPTNQVVFADDTATLQAAVTGLPPISYHWFFNGTSLANATNTTLIIPSAQTNHAGSYSLVASNAYGVSTSSIALLTVREAPQFAFVQRGTGKGPDRGTGIAAAIDGSIYVVGTFSNALHLGATNLQGTGGNDIFMVKYDHQGQLSWAKIIGGPGNDSGYAVGIDPFGFIYFSGSVTGLVTFDAQPWSYGTDRVGFLAKYHSSGTLLWVRTNSGSSRLAFDRAANIYALATGPAIFEKYDTNGTLLYRQWADTSSATLNSLSNRDIAVDAQTNVFVVSRFSGTLSLTNYAHTNVTLTEIWNFRPPTAVMKFNASGKALWGRRLGGCYECLPEEVRAVAVDSFGNAYVCGGLPSGGFIVQFDPGGASRADFPPPSDLWARGYLDTNNFWSSYIGAQIYDIAVHDGSNIFIAGSFSAALTNPRLHEDIQTHSAGLEDGFVARLDSHGVPLEAKRLGGSTNDAVLSLALDPAGNPCVTGFFGDVASFGTQTLISSGSEDVFVARLQMAVPTLTIAAVLNQQLRLSWPILADGFSLESSSSITGPFIPVTHNPDTDQVSFENIVTLPLQPGAQQFFRLRRP